MNELKRLGGTVLGLMLLVSARAEVRVFVQDTNGVAWVKYECTAGEVVRAFALDVSVDRGAIIGISNYFRGPCTAGAAGYGIFPASFRDHLMAEGTNVDWSSPAYTPLADVGDSLGGTLPGLNSSGVTLEFGSLWDSTVPESGPATSGTLCALGLSQAARVSIAANTARCGVVSAFPQNVITAVFTGASVGPAVTSASLQNGVMTILFQGGELQRAESVNGPWADTGDLTGDHSESLGTNQTRFYRVRSP